MKKKQKSFLKAEMNDLLRMVLQLFSVAFSTLKVINHFNLSKIALKVERGVWGERMMLK